MNELVQIINNQVVVSSRQVAEHFEKRHDHVIASIREISSQMNSPQFSGLFQIAKYKASNGKSNPEYLMNRDGFTLLAMGFTGERALQWKLKYINAFNVMEKRIKDVYKIPQTYAEALRLAATQAETIELLEAENSANKQVIVEMQPKASYYDLILQSKSVLSVTQIAKDYGKSAVWLNKKLHELKAQYRQGGIWVLYQKYADKGYTQTKTYPADEDKTNVHTYWTQKGRIFIYNLLKEKGILPTIEKEEKANGIQ